jgi:uncharacterized membrane protein
MLSGDFLGINLRDFAIGMQGGFAGVYLLRKPKAKFLLAHGMVGGVLGNYGGFVAQALIEKTAHEMCITISHDASSDLGCLIVGLCGMAILHKIVIPYIESKGKRLTK